MRIEKAVKGKRMNKTTKRLGGASSVLFDSRMRKAFIEGVMQDIKGWVELNTNGAVEVKYEDFNLKGHEFGFVLHAFKTQSCTKQVYVEAVDAIVNIASYMLQGDDSQYNISFAKSNDVLDVEFVSNW